MSTQAPNPKTEDKDKLSKLDELLKGVHISQDKRKEIITMISAQFSGPLPHPELFRQYEEVLPGCAKEIVEAFKKQSNHRMQLEDHAVKEQIKQSGRGQMLGTAIVVLCLVAGVVLTLYGHDWVGGTIFTTTVLGLAATYIKGKEGQTKELNDKKPKNGSTNSQKISGAQRRRE